jgi:hypothetical protein
MKNQACLEFVSETGRRKVGARLVNISRAGALTVTEETPALHESLWLRIEYPVKTDWIGAVTIRLGQYREVAVRFEKSCPDDFLLAAILGIDLSPIIIDGGRPGSSDDIEL